MEELTVMSKFYTNTSCVYHSLIKIYFCFHTLLACPVIFRYCCSTYTAKNNDHQLFLCTYIFIIYFS